MSKIRSTWVFHIIHRFVHRVNRENPCQIPVFFGTAKKSPQLYTGLWRFHWFTEQLLKCKPCGEDPLVFFPLLPVGIHLQAAVLQEAPLHGKLLALPGFA